VSLSCGKSKKIYTASNLEGKTIGALLSYRPPYMAIALTRMLLNRLDPFFENFYNCSICKVLLLVRSYEFSFFYSCLIKTANVDINISLN